MSANLDKRETMLLFAVTVAGLAAALVFSFVVYPRMRESCHMVLDPDEYGHLGINLWRGYGLSFNPDDGPTIYRGPLYPGFIAFILLVSSGWYPGGIWLAQSLLHGLTSLFVCLTAMRCWNRSTALLAGFGCAFYPLLFWYTPRMWTESLLMFLVTCLIYFSVILIAKCAVWKAVGIGILLGLLCLVKGVFLPLIFLLPVCFYFLLQRRKLTVTLTTAFVAALLVTPWTVRNYLLTGRIVPVHTGAGGNLKLGNAFARDFLINPFSYDEIWQRNIRKIRSLTAGIRSSSASADIQKEDIYMAGALADIRSDPGLLVRKVLVAGSMFWYIGENRTKTVVLLVLRVPVLILAFLGIYRTICYKEKRLWPAIVVVLTYWISHLPFAPAGRLSVPIMPILFAFAMSNWFWFREKQPKAKPVTIRR